MKLRQRGYEALPSPSDATGPGHSSCRFRDRCMPATVHRRRADQSCPQEESPCAGSVGSRGHKIEDMAPAETFSTRRRRAENPTARPRLRPRTTRPESWAGGRAGRAFVAVAARPEANAPDPRGHAVRARRTGEADEGRIIAAGSSVDRDVAEAARVPVAALRGTTAVPYRVRADLRRWRGRGGRGRRLHAVLRVARSGHTTRQASATVLVPLAGVALLPTAG